MPTHLSLQELYRIQENKVVARHVSFDRILELCHRRIRTIASHNGMNTVYEVPGLLVGYPLYNIHECCKYITKKLREDGFLVQALPPPHVAALYVSWDPEELSRLRIAKPKGLPKPPPGMPLNLSRIGPPGLPGLPGLQGFGQGSRP